MEANDQSIGQQLLSECKGMTSYALTSGMKVPPNMVLALEQIERSWQNAGTEQKDNFIKNLANIHNKLTDIVAPAKPRSILYIQNAAKTGKFWAFLGPIVLTRRMILIALISLTAMILLSLSPHVNDDKNFKGLFDHSGLPLLINLLFQLSAAGLGASFAALLKVKNFIASNTYDPKYDATYYTRFVLGLIAGLILTQIVPVNVEQDMFIEHEVAILCLAFLGGFSTTAVNRILNRMIYTIESMIKGETGSQSNEGQKDAGAMAAQEIAAHKMEMATGLLKLQQQLNDNPDPQALKQTLQKMMEQSVPGNEPLAINNDQKD